MPTLSMPRKAINRLRPNSRGVDSLILMLSFGQSTNLILVHDDCPDHRGKSLLRLALSSEPIAGVIRDGLSGSSHQSGRRAENPRFPGQCDFAKTICAIPQSWEIGHRQSQVLRDSRSDTRSDVIHYREDVCLGPELVGRTGASRAGDRWLVVSNGRFVTQISIELLGRVLAGVRADVLAANAKPALLGEREKVRLTTEGNVAGFRRMYSDAAESAFFPEDWPHHLFIRASVLDQILVDGVLPQSFSAFSERCQSQSLALRAMNVGGVVLDLETEGGMLGFCRMKLSPSQDSKPDPGGSSSISPDARLVGKVLLGSNVYIAPKAIIIGPTIIGDDVKIEQGAVIDSSIIGPAVRVRPNQIVRDCIAEGPQCDWKAPGHRRGDDSGLRSHPTPHLDLWDTAQVSFRSWPRLSYARCLKRIADCLAAMMVLLLFAPLMPFVALAIKLTSPGPVFYRDKRQGLHGKEFGCLKFRTMVSGAAKIQEQLRIVSQVDGPQFKMDDDPRISTVGRFLRETYIDEIPQFFNVLFGQMSIVGPRPSPESENTSCPSWRDARLSVRPGITGLWQVHRTREPMKDFQEWIHYDTEYVRNLSLKMDLLTCWQTARKLCENFISQF